MKKGELETAKILMNPFYCITIDMDLSEDHIPLISKDMWIETQMRLLEELGSKEYFKNLLLVLEGKYVK
jgi:hypothetical protein